MISSFDQKPANGTTPALASERDQEGPEGDRHVLAQAAHLLDVLLLVHAVDHAAAAEEEQPLKKACVIRWKIAGIQAPAPSAKRHVAELADASNRRRPA